MSVKNNYTKTNQKNAVYYESTVLQLSLKLYVTNYFIRVKAIFKINNNLVDKLSIKYYFEV